MKPNLKKFIALEILAWLNLLALCWLMVLKVVPISNLLAWAFLLFLLLLAMGSSGQANLIVEKYPSIGS